MNILRSYSADTPGPVTRDYRILANLVTGACVCGMASLSLCVWWLAAYQDSAVRKLALALFLGQLALLIVSAVAVLVVFVRKDREPVAFG